MIRRPSLPPLTQCIPCEVCLACQGCCRFSSCRSAWSPYFLAEEAKKLQKNNFRVPLRAASHKAKLRPENGTYFCPLFDASGNKCQAYALRPFDCRLYPFLLQKKKSGVYLAVDTNCPFVYEHVQSPQFSKAMEAVLGYMRKPVMRALVRRNPGLTARFPEKSVRTIERI